MPLHTTGFGCFTLLDFSDPTGRGRDGLLNLNPTSSGQQRDEVYFFPKTFQVRAVRVRVRVHGCAARYSRRKQLAPTADTPLPSARTPTIPNSFRFF